MGLINIVFLLLFLFAPLLLKTLHYLISMKYFLNANNCWHKQNFEKNVQLDFTFTFDVPSASCIDFVSFLVLLALEHVASFAKTPLYRKRSRVTMCNYVEMFHANIDHNLKWNLLSGYLSYRNQNLRTPSSKRYNFKTRRPQPHILMFFLISYTNSISCTIANLVFWMPQKSYNVKTHFKGTLTQIWKSTNIFTFIWK